MKSEKEFLSDSIIAIDDELIVVVERGQKFNGTQWRWELHESGEVNYLSDDIEADTKIIATIGPKRLEGVPLIEFVDNNDYMWQLAVAETDGYCTFDQHAMDCGCGDFVSGYKAASKDKNWSDAEVREMMHKAFYEGREVKRLASPNNQPIFKQPTYEGWLRDTKVLSPKRKVPTRLVFDPNSADSTDTIFIDPSKVEYAIHN